MNNSLDDLEQKCKLIDDKLEKLLEKPNFASKNPVVYYLILLLVYASYVLTLKIIQEIIYKFYPDNWLTNSFIAIIIFILIIVTFRFFKLETIL